LIANSVPVFGNDDIVPSLEARIEKLEAEMAVDKEYIKTLEHDLGLRAP
jgi:hypothetical protein